MTTKSPRTRDNTNTSLAHNAYPGGKILRKRMARLARRRIGDWDKMKGMSKPGSMAK